MPGVDPPWTQPQNTQFCAECERLARRLEEAKIIIANCRLALKVLRTMSDVSDLTPAKEATEDMLEDIESFLTPKAGDIGSKLRSE